MTIEMKATIKIFIIAVTVILSGACSSKLEGIYNRQESQIDTYVAKYESTNRIVRNGGANRIVMKEGEGEELSNNGYVSFYYAAYTFTGSISNSNLLVTNHQATAEQAGWNLTDAEYELYEIDFGSTGLLSGLKDGLAGVKAGEECEILFSGKYAFGDKPFGIIPANSAMLYKIWVIGVSNE